ncbi:hypothetical protein [Nonomuraea sp. NEAU-A123]|uniref:hypothetical protein n=1 Tax=Nonomuraea sp. NEAU-A123 TaxID=2839649 RepID=UPI001BE4E136|nr:hypothetical protein [Nonomuraea sp. NEAU-A123]MBT2226242.1 hypothetical protein [Nonomuraea sp. NEAU-A123]
MGGVELSNAARTIAYMREGLKPSTTTVEDCSCPDLALMLDDEPYRTPLLDGAAWVDHAEPDSYDFAGLLITDISGLDNAPVQRSVTDRIGDGAVIGRARRGPRVITVTGLLIGATPCAVDYGLRWLTSALAGALPCAPGASCAGDDLDYMTCCPEICEDSPDFTSYPECAARVFRTLREVAMTTEPQITNRIGDSAGGCGGSSMYEVTFTLTAGRPHALRGPVMVADDVHWDLDDADVTCIEWSTDPECVSEIAACEALEAADCLIDPHCPPPVIPAIPVPANPCYCEPLERRRLCIDIPADAAPLWADQVTDLELYTGESPLRGVRIRLYPNPAGLPVDELDPCGFCSEINISYLPASSLLRLDGTRRRATVQCPGRAETPAGGVVFGPAGRPFSWPVLECAVPYVMCVEADAATIAADAAVTLRTVVRES